MLLYGYIDKYNLDNFFVSPIYKSDGKYYLAVIDNDVIDDFEIIDKFADIEIDKIKTHKTFNIFNEIEFKQGSTAVHVLKSDINNLIVGSRYYITNKMMKDKSVIKTNTAKRFCKNTTILFSCNLNKYNHYKSIEPYVNKTSKVFDILFLKKQISK